MTSFNDFIGQLWTVSWTAACASSCRWRAASAPSRPTTRSSSTPRLPRVPPWKRYRGGMADDLWVYDFATKETEQLNQDRDQEIIRCGAGTRLFPLRPRDLKR